MKDDETTRSSHKIKGPQNNDIRNFSNKKIALGVPIDHGWAWICAGAGFALYVLFAGTVRSLGLILVEISSTYQSSNRQTAFIFTLTFIFLTALSPVANGLADRFGTRRVIFMGGLLVAFANFVSVFAASIEYLYLSYGCLLGLGFSFIHGPCLVHVSSYFVRHRSLAVSITLAGASVGSFVIPPLTYILIETYGLRGTFLILSGLHLNTCVCAALMRPMSYFERRASEKEICKEHLLMSSTSIPLVSSSEKLEPYQTAHISISLEKMQDVSSSSHHSTMLRKAASENYLSERKTFFDTSDPTMQMTSDTKQIASNSNAIYSIFASFGDITVVLTENRNILEHNGSVNSMNKILKTKNKMSFCQNLYHNLLHSLNWKLWCEPTFVLLALNIAIVTNGLPMFFMIIPSYTVDVGMAKETGANIIFWMGASDLITRLSIGLLSDRLNINYFRAVVYLLCTLLLSVMWFILPSLSNFGFVGFIVGSQFIAMFGGAIICLAPIVLSDFVGIVNLSSAWGFSMLLESFLLIAIPMLLGYLRDETASWFFSINIIGSLLLFGGILMISAMIIEKMCNRTIAQIQISDDT